MLGVFSLFRLRNTTALLLENALICTMFNRFLYVGLSDANAAVHLLHMSQKRATEPLLNQLTGTTDDRYSSMTVNFSMTVNCFKKAVDRA